MKDSEYICLYTCDYQGMHLEVLEKGGQRSLQSDRSIIHSRFQLNDPTVLLQPYQQQMVASLFFLSGLPKKILILGLGGACQVAYIHRYYPDVQQDVVECSEEIIKIARDYFYLPKSQNITVYHQDAMNVANIFSGEYDLIFLDLCDSDGPIAYFQEVPFLQVLRGLLSPNGWITANTWSDSKILKQEIRLWEKVFPFVYSLENNGSEAVIYAGLHSVDIQRSATKSVPQNLAQHLLKLH